MEIFAVWVILSIVIGAIGSSRKIGFGGAFAASLLLSPLIGFIITIVSKDKEQEKMQNEMLRQQKAQTAALQNAQTKPNQQSMLDELERISKLKDYGDITQEEYQKLKNSIIEKID